MKELHLFGTQRQFSNWKSLSNRHDIDIYFANPGIPSQRGLNENSNGLLRRGGLPKKMDFNEIPKEYVVGVADRRNNIPRKSLNYKTPLECMTEHMDQLELSRLIGQFGDLGAKSDSGEVIKLNSTTENDFRLRIEKPQLARVVKWFQKGELRENVDNLTRELKEELLDTNILPKESFMEISYTYVGQDISDMSCKV